MHVFHAALKFQMVQGSAFAMTVKTKSALLTVITAGFVVTDRSSIVDDSKPQEYYEQVQVLESYEELEIARGSAYYALFAQMQKMAEEN